MKIASLFEKTSMQTKLVVPIIILALVGGLIGTKVIENALIDHITKVQKHEVKNYANKIFYVLSAEYKTLFFEFGKDVHYFNQAQEASKKSLLPI
jgi:hypothetical protein